MSRRCSTTRTSCWRVSKRLARCAAVRPPPAINTNMLPPLRRLQPLTQRVDRYQRGAQVHDIACLETVLRGGEDGFAYAGQRHGQTLACGKEILEGTAVPSLRHREFIDLDFAIAGREHASGEGGVEQLFDALCAPTGRTDDLEAKGLMQGSPARMIVADDHLGHMVDGLCYVRDDRVERVGVGDGGQTVGLFNTRSAEYISSQRLAFHCTSAEVCGQII